MGAIKHHPLLSAADFLREKKTFGDHQENRRLYGRKLSFSVCLFVGFPFPVKHTDTLGGTHRACKYTHRSHMMKRSRASSPTSVVV